jgi:hypothetical protein
MWIKVSDKELVNANQLGCIVYKYNEVVSTIDSNKLVLYKGFYAREVYDKIMEAIENNKSMVDISTYSEF